MVDAVTATAWIDDLRERMAGRVVVPGDADYDGLRIVGLGQIDARPAAIARVTCAADVAAAVDIARRTGLALAVRSGGHSGAGHGTVEGGLVIDLREMKRLEIDADAMTAWADTGLTAGEVVGALAERGLVLGFGDTGSVGIGGITVGGGIGYLVRKHGLTIDNLLAAEIVTADGQLVRADIDTHPDLFWAIRGGGGNFGVATRFLYRLYPAEDFVGGMLILPATPATITGFIDAARAAPEELSVIVNVMPCPPMPFVPAEQHGRTVIFAQLGYTGDADAGEQAVRPLREPIVDMVKRMPYPQMFVEPEGGEEQRPMIHEQTLYLSAVDEGRAQAIIVACEASDAPLRAVQLRPLGGAMARVPEDATAFAHRDAPIMAVVVSFYESDETLAEREKWVRDLAAALDDGTPGAYINFMMDDGEAGVRRAYPAVKLERLARIKSRYDPANLFRVNQNVPPVEDGERPQ
jgi:FAD/FMN-containing dehydrogenase